MLSPDRSRAVAELDALTADLPGRADQLARRVDRLNANWSRPGVILNGRRWIDGTAVCPACLDETCDCPAPLNSAEAPTVVVAGGVCYIRQGEALCVWCGEPAGNCSLTGGGVRCDGATEQAANHVETVAAPRIWPPFRVGGC